MSFIQAPVWLQLTILFLNMAGMLNLFALLFQLISDQKKNKNYILLILLIVIDVLIFETMEIGYRNPDSPWTESVFMNFSFWIYLVWGFVILGIGVAGQIHLHKYLREEFSRSSVRQAIDNLPTGLCYSDEQGRAILTNAEMYRFIRKLSGQNVFNIKLLFEDLQKESFVKEIEAKGIKLLEYYSNAMEGQYAFAFPDGEVYQIVKSGMSLEGEHIEQTVVSKITTLYKLYEQNEKYNKKLLEQGKAIYEYADNLILLNHEEEILTHKIQIHNEMGQVIMQTRYFLEQAGELEQYYELAEQWEKIALKFANQDENKNKKSGELLEEIFEVARAIGCEVSLQGKLPETKPRGSLIRQTIREAIINAVKHGNATKVSIVVKDLKASSGECDSKAKVIEITNNGQLPKEEIKLGGGLSNLKASFEKIGDLMEIETKEQFCIRLLIKALGD